MAFSATVRSKSFAGVLLVLAGIAAWLLLLPKGNSRARAEREHGIELPPSATHIQSRGDAWRGFFDRGALTMFEMSSNDVSRLVAQLKVKSRRPPVRRSGDPTENGYNVWPGGSPTFVPGNSVYEGLKRTWHGEAVPIEMLSCSSSTGDWLHVELWRLESGMVLVKMYTDWN